MRTRVIIKCFFILATMAIVCNNYAQQPTQIAATEFAISNNTIHEKIFAHTDKNFYITGEIVWFKLYDVFADSLKPSDLSNIAYVEILNSKQKAVLQATVALNNGSGNGSFYLPSSIASGNYIFRAYTNWMKNFGADKFFQKQITIVNTLTQLPKPSGSDSINNYEIGFFPEGGNLINGIESKVAFKVTDIYSNGVNCDGVITDENKRNIVSFSTLKFGMGSFYFTPQSNHTYNAVLNINGKTITKELPASIEKGYVMHVYDDDQQVKVALHSSYSAQTAYLIAYSNNKIEKSLMQSIGDNNTSIFSLDKKDLSAGISHIVVFDANKQPVCERMIFIQPTLLQLSVSPDKDSYSTRSEVKLNVNSGDIANLSMSVYLVDSLQTLSDNNILSYLWLTSELKGRIESPQYYFNNRSKEVDSALENLLLTQGWTRFKQNDDLSAMHQPLLRFAPEHEGHIIEGRVTNKVSGLPAVNVRVFLSVPGKYFHFGTAVSNDSGKVFFDIKDFYGSGELVLQTSEADSIYRIEVADPFYNGMSGFRATSLNLSQNELQLLSQHSLAMQVQNAYSLNQLNKFISPLLDSNAFYGRPDAQYYLDNYVRFNTMEEVLREYVTNVNVRLRQGNYSLIINDERNHFFFDNNPLVLVDGVPIFDMNKVIAYNPLKIKKADVLMRKYYINSYTANGILSYSTYKGDLDGFQFDPGTIELSYDGLQLEREFYSPQYNTDLAKRSRMADYRNVLYWAPEMITNPNTQVSFYTSDVKGKYLVVLQGIGANGKLGYTVSGFEVR